MVEMVLKPGLHFIYLTRYYIAVEEKGGREVEGNAQASGLKTQFLTNGWYLSLRQEITKGISMEFAETRSHSFFVDLLTLRCLWDFVV